MDYLGLEVTDNITDFTGIVTEQVEYITGCNQVLIVPLKGSTSVSVGSDKSPHK